MLLLLLVELEKILLGLKNKFVKGFHFGVELDEEKNAKRLPGNVELSTENSKVKIYKIETAEELVIARDTYELTK